MELLLTALEEPPPLGELMPALALFLALLLVAALVSATEFALLGFSKVRRRQLVEEKHPRIDAVERLMSKPQRVLVALLCVKIVANVGAAGLAAVVATRYWGTVGLIATLALVTLIMLVLVEITPKAYASRHPEKTALRLAPMLLGMTRVLAPLTWTLDRITTGTFRVLGVKPGGATQHFHSEEELKTLITLGTEEGILEEDEEELIQSVIEFGDTTAKEVMVPRIDMTAVPGDATLEHVRTFILDSGYSRIPVYEGSIDNVVGVLYVKDMLRHLVEKEAGTHVRELMRDPTFVPESMKVSALMAEMQENRVHVAIVTDEFGGTAGLVTLEDVLEEIVGEIFDEYDLRQDPVRRIDAQTAVIDARTHVADVNDELDIEIPEDEAYDTLGGFVHHELGRLGREGEIVHGKGFDVIVEKVSNRRIVRARIVKQSPPQADGDLPGDIASP